MENSAASSELQVAVGPSNHQPDMLPSAGDSEGAGRPPDMLPSGEQAGHALPEGGQMEAQADMEERLLSAEVETGASGPDILSNGMRGDERTRPDILSPATEDCSTATEGNFLAL